MRKYLLLTLLILPVVFFSGCAHPIIITPDMANLQREPGSPAKIASRVGYYIPESALGIEVTTPGGGGDSVRYFPYRDLEAGYQKVLNNVYQNVTKVSSSVSPEQLTADNISYVLTPKVITSSSSAGVMTWPPTNFTVDLTTSVRDASGKLIGSPRVVGYGHYTVQLGFSAEHGTAGKRAMEDALLQMQRALLELPYNRTQGSANKSISESDSPKASGSGAIVTTDGYVLTAAHVVAHSNAVKVITSKGTRTAQIIRIDEANDLAVLKLEEGEYPAIPIAPSRQVKLGQPVATIGFPNIELQGFSPKVTKGDINSLNGFGDDPRAWQISVPLQPGNSGGALIDESGSLVGVVVSGLSWKVINVTGSLPQNVNYAVKSVYANALLEPYLGSNTPSSDAKPSAKPFEDIVAKAQQSAVLILVY